RPGSPPPTPTARAASDQPPAAPTGDDPIATAARNFNAADGLLINGSVNNGASSPFAQMAAFGNNRRGQRSLYTGNLGILYGNSAFDASPFSFSARPLPSPSYDDVQILGAFNGPIRIPGLGRNRPNVQVGYQRVVDHNATTQSVRMPTLAERRGDFSGTVNAQGNPVQIVNPASGQPFQNNRIPDEQI